ncbi:hypothetical protein PV325_006014 [Microctonus aethiopoides]|nr:hypothetical protein PV325_006014 [Microctonus aethiopoides]KAK0082977.1 hypothetical protein PV326_006923 [Microctonus aethiopoides]
MALFDEKVSINIKKQMMFMLKSIDKSSEKSKRLEIKNISDLYNLNIASFISSSKGLMLVRNLKGVNDISERAVKLVEDYNGILNKNPEQQQFIIQFLAECKQYCDDSRKSSIVENMKLD